MKKPPPKKLADLGADQFAEAMVELAKNNEDVARYVARATADEATNVKRFKAELNKIRRRRRFIPYGEASSYADRLDAMLEDLEASVTDPDSGVSLVANFYRADSAVLEACDDSDGSIGDVFHVHARDLFVHYARHVRDKVWLAELVRDLVRADDYGVRDRLLTVAAKYLPQDTLRDLARRFWQDAETARAAEPADERARNVLSVLRAGNSDFRLVEVVARQLNDAELFERARREFDSRLGTASKTHIAAAWLTAGKPETALVWLDRINRDDHFFAHERDDLLHAIHERLGNREEVERLAWKRFREGRSDASLEDLLRVIGAHKRNEVIAAEARIILASDSFKPGDAAFLLDCGLVEEAASCVVARRALVDGQRWSELVPLAKALQRLGQHVAATVIYRALLDAILERGYSPAYRHGARYLRQLAHLAAHAADWDGMPTHDAYVASVRARHGRKSSFWAFYDTMAE